MTNNGTGKGGKSFQDREAAAQLRSLTIKECTKALSKGKGRLYEMVLGKLAGTILPRLNEHTGENGGPMVLELSEVIAKKNGLHATHSSSIDDC